MSSYDVRSFVAGVLSFLPQFEAALVEQDNDLLRALARVFVDAAGAWVWGGVLAVRCMALAWFITRRLFVCLLFYSSTAHAKSA